MQTRRKQSWSDIFLIGGFVLSFCILVGVACFEACKIVGNIPSVFDSSTTVWSNPMNSSVDDGPSNDRGSRTMTPRERARQQPSDSR
jgi:hypothetical protein